MTDFTSDGTPFETPIGQADQGYATTPPSLSRSFAAMFHESSGIEQLGRVAEQGQFAGSSPFAKALYDTATTDPESGEPFDPIAPASGSVVTPMLAPEEANAKYAPIGPDGKQVSITSAPMPEGVAQLVGKAKQAEIDRESVIARYTQSSGQVAAFSLGVPAFLLDPLNLSTGFLPGVGEESIAARLGGGFLARTGARLAAGAASGAIAQAPLSALRYGLGQQEASDYDLRSAFKDLAFGAAGGAILHAGLGTAGDALKWQRGEGGSPTLAPDAAPILTADASTQADAMRASVSQMVEGRQVDASPFYYQPPETMTAIDQAMKPSPNRAILTGIEPTTAAQARRIAPDVFAEYDPLRARVSELRESIADPQQAFGAPIDARISDLERQRAETSSAPTPVGLPDDQLHAAVAAGTEQWKSLSDEIDRLRSTRDAEVRASVEDARQRIIASDQRMRDLAPLVTDATKRAEILQSAAGANRMVAMGPKRPVLDIPALAETQRQLYRDGFAPGLTQLELGRADADLFGPSESGSGSSSGPAADANGPAASLGSPPSEAKASTPSAPLATRWDEDLQKLEEAHAQNPAIYTADEQAELDRTSTALTQTSALRESYAEAAACLAARGAANAI